LNKLRSINPEQLASFLRTVLQILGGVVIANGYFDANTWLTLSGAVVTIVVTGWGLWARSDTNLIKSAAAVPAVTKVVAPGTAVANDPSVPKVAG
jgi:hypothetical protein